MDRFSTNGSAPKKRKPSLIERDRQADQTLSTRYDTLNQLFTEAEVHLKVLKPLHPVWVAYGHTSYDGGPSEWELLGLTKHNGKWRLCHATDNDLNDEGYLRDLKPIIECPVDVRVRAAKAVRQLHEAIVKSKEEYIPKVEEAIRELSSLCSDLDV